MAQLVSQRAQAEYVVVVAHQDEGINSCAGFVCVQWKRHEDGSVSAGGATDPYDCQFYTNTSTDACNRSSSVAGFSRLFEANNRVEQPPNTSITEAPTPEPTSPPPLRNYTESETKMYCYNDPENQCLSQHAQTSLCVPPA